MPTDNNAYRKNIQDKSPQQLSTWSYNESSMPTSRDVYQKIAEVQKTDPERSAQLAYQFYQFQNTKGSQFYNSYSQATNQAVGNLNSMGINTSGMTSDWFKQNTEWQKHLVYSGTTNSPVSPGKKATAQQKMAYQMWQLSKATETTEKMDSEWAAMQQEIFYWTQRTDLNLSDDDIIARIDKDKKTKYPTLYAMDNSTQPGQSLLEINHGTNYSKDNLYGVIWAARNGKSTGNTFGDNLMSASGKGNVWQKDEKIAAKMDRSNLETYSPYSVGMTADTVGAYFNVTGIDDKMLAEIEKTIDWNNETDVKMYNKAYDALQTTKKAEQELSDLQKKIDGYISNGYSEEKILKNLDTLLSGSNFSTLRKMDDSIQRRDSRDDMVQTSYAVNYRKQDIVNYIKDTCRKNSTLKNANSIAYAGIVGSQTVKTPESVEAEATTLWQSQQKATSEYTDIGIREARKEIEKTSPEADTNTAVAPEAEKPDDQKKPTFEELEEAYDKEHGKGAYRRDIVKANGMTSQIGAMDAGDAKVRDTAASFSDDMNPAETSVFKGYSGSQDAAQKILADKRNEWLNKGLPGNVTEKQTKTSNVGYIQSVMNYYPGIKDYEKASKSIETLEASIAENREKLGAKWYIGRTNDLSFETEIDGSKYRVTMLPDLSDIDTIENVDQADAPRPLYARFGIYDEEPDTDTRVWQSIASDEQTLNAFREKYLAEEQNIQAAAGLELTPEDEELRAKIRQDEIALEDAKKYVSKNQAEYEKNRAEMDREQQRRDTHIKNLEAMGQDTTSVKIADTVLDSLYSFNDYDATIWEEYNPTYTYTQLLDMGAEKETVLDMARKEHDEIVEQIKDLEFLQKYVSDNGIKLNDNVAKNMDRRMAKLKRDLKDSEFFEVQFSSDFEQVAAAGKAYEEANVQENARNLAEDPYDFEGSLNATFGDHMFYLTEDEKNTFFYLREKDRMNGTHKAEEYADLLDDRTYGVLSVRQANAMEQAAAGATEKTPFLANVFAVGLSPYTAIASFFTNVDTKLSGRELNPDDSRLNTMKFRSSVRQATAESILKAYGEKDENGNIKETTKSKIVQGLYEMVTNRADSAINAAAFGWMFGGVGNEMLREFLSASPMGISAATEAAVNAKKKGASDEQAYGIAAATFIAETATEAVSLENMRAARGIGEATTGHAVKDFLKNWLTKAGLSEMIGESVNDIIENAADRAIMGELSEHAEKVRAYREAGYSEEDAEMMARKDELKGVLRTAIMSYLSPGLDAFQTAATRYNYYRAATKEAQKENPNISLRQVRRGIIEQERAEAAGGPQVGPVAAGPQQAEQAAPAENVAPQAEQAPKSPGMTAAEQFTADFEILETASGGDRSAQNAAVAAVLDNGTTSEVTDHSNAAATNFADLMQNGKSAAEEVQDLLIGANVADIDANIVKIGVRFAALGGDESACRQVVQSDAYQMATPDQKATMLAEAVQTDYQNPAVQEAVTQNVHEYRVAREEAKLIEQGAGNPIIDAETDAEVAAMETQKAQDALTTQQDVEEAARRAVTRISADELQRDPANDSVTNDLRQALDKLQKQAAVTQEYKQSLKNAQDREEAAKQKAEQVKQETLRTIREQAEQTVAQQDQQRTEENARAMEEAKAAAEQAEKVRVQQEAKNNANVADVEGFIELQRQENPNMTAEEERVLREKFADVLRKMQGEQTEVEDERDANGNLTEQAKQARNKALEFVNRKFGLPVVLTDDIQKEDPNGIYSDGFYDDKNHRIVISNNLSFNEIMSKVLPHELLHSLEKAGTYTNVANSLLGIVYGEDADFEQAISNLEKNNGKATTRLEQDIVQIKKKYDEATGETHDFRYAAQEIAAMRMGQMFYNPDNPQQSQDLINRLAAEKPSAARQILESIKSMVKKALGMKGAWLSNAQKTVDMFEKALSQNAEENAEKKNAMSFVAPSAKDTTHNSLSNEQYEQALVDNGITNPKEEPTDELLFYTSEENAERSLRNFSFDEDTGELKYYGYTNSSIEEALESSGFVKENITNAETGDTTGYYYKANRKGIDFNTLKALNSYINESKNKKYSLPEAQSIAENDNVIPPSERFQTNNPDIRYSLPSDDILEDKIMQYLRNGGILGLSNDKYSRPLEGQNPTMSTAQGPAVRGFAGIEGLLNKSDEVGRFAKAVANAQNTYYPDTNASQIARAIKWIGSLKQTPLSDGYAEALQAVTSDDFDYRSADGQARMVAVIGLANAKNDTMAQVALVDAYMRQRTDIARAFQAGKIFKLMTPEGRIATLKDTLNKAQKELNMKGTNVNLTFSQWIYEAAAAAESDTDFRKVQQAAYKELGEQIPANWKDRIRSLRMFSMLANPRTHIRNIVGNALFIPAVSLKNKIGAAVETGLQASGKLGEGERTKTLSLVVDKSRRDFARQDAETMKTTLTGEAKFSEATQIKKNQGKLGKAFDWLSDKNSDWLEKEDWFFLKGHYRRALGGWMQANGYTVEQVQNDQALLEKGRAYAIEEAQKATYRDFNKTAQTLNQVSKKGGVAGFLLDAALPFKKTPANILKRGIEYSPVGLVKSLTADMAHMKQYLDYQNGKLNALPEKAMSPTQVVDHICAGLSGSMITAIGFLLAGAGVVTCGLDDDEDKLEKLKGNQEYSVNISKLLGLIGVPKLFGEDVTYTMDWAAPMSMPFFVGAAIRDQMEREGATNINEVANAIANIAEPVFNLSMLDGVNSLFKTSQYDDTNAITQILAKIVTNYGSSYVPAALGATTRTFFDDTRRKSFVTSGENTGIEGTMRYAWESIENKIPGLSKTNIPYRDVWGNAETSGLAERIFENFISPGYVTNYKDDLVVNELSRLYEETGDAAMIPKDAEKSITYNKKKYALSPEDYDKYVVSRGQAAYKGLADLMKSDAYKKASSDEQKEQVKKVWEYANQVGKKAVIPDYKMTASDDVLAAASSGSVAYYKDAMITALDANDFSAFDTCVQALHDNGETDTKIKEKIRNTYINKYKEAYRKQDYVTMLDIEDMLDRTGYDFNYQGWQDAVDEEG